MTDVIEVKGVGALQPAEKTFWDFVEEWLSALEGGNGTGKKAKAQKTINSYRYNLQAFKEWMDSENIAQPDRQTVKRYRDALDAKRTIQDGKSAGWTAASKNAYLASVRSFFTWLSREYGFENIAAGVEGWAVSSEHKRGFLSLSEMRQLLNVVDTADLRGKRKKLTKRDEELITLRRLRDKAILSILCGGGLRTVEVSRLRVADLYREAGIDYLSVLGKGRGEREGVKISAQVAETIRTWSSAREAVDIVSDESPLFCSLSYSSFGDELTPHAISCLVKFYLEVAGLKTKTEKKSGGKSDKNDDKIVRKPVTAHSLRGSLATNSYLNGASLEQVKQQLRHRRAETTLIYIREAEKSLNPCTDIVSAAIFC